MLVFSWTQKSNREFILKTPGGIRTILGGAISRKHPLFDSTIRFCEPLLIAMPGTNRAERRASYSRQ